MQLFYRHGNFSVNFPEKLTPLILSIWMGFFMIFGIYIQDLRSLGIYCNHSLIENLLWQGREYDVQLYYVAPPKLDPFLAFQIPLAPF